MSAPLCNICRSPMTVHESLHQDCGGDCLLCMADVGDDACVATVLRLARSVVQTTTAAEREACAQFCDTVAAGTDDAGGSFDYGWLCAAEHIAVGIRSRGLAEKPS